MNEEGTWWEAWGASVITPGKWLVAATDIIPDAEIMVPESRVERLALNDWSGAVLVLYASQQNLAHYAIHTYAAWAPMPGPGRWDAEAFHAGPVAPVFSALQIANRRAERVGGMADLHRAASKTLSELRARPYLLPARTWERVCAWVSAGRGQCVWGPPDPEGVSPLPPALDQPEGAWTGSLEDVQLVASAWDRVRAHVARSERAELAPPALEGPRVVRWQAGMRLVGGWSEELARARSSECVLSDTVVACAAGGLNERSG